jgi:aminopeptidase N
MRRLLLLLCLLPFPVRAEWHAHGGWKACSCKGRLLRSLPLDPDAAHAGNGRKYARDREIDVKHVRLELDPDFAKRSLVGKATLTFAPIAKPLAQLRLDAVDLAVGAVESSAALKGWDTGKTAITLTFAQPVAPGAETSVTVTYTAEPEDGWFYRTEAMGYPKGDDHFWTQGEPERHRHWFPGYDYPNERFTSEVICRVPKGMTVLSNGRLVEESAAGDKTLFHWKQEQEHVNYLISVVGGHFKKLEAKHGDLPLAFLTPPSEFAVAENSFRDTASILAFFDEETGVKFPWAKYYSVCVTDFIAGGMENTSVTTLTTDTLFSSESENLRTSHRLDAHEAAHQWFGDLVTCKDWSHLWLNEGFATYYTHLYDGKKSGEDEMRYQLLGDLRQIVSNPDEKPIVWRGYADPMEQFDYRAYPKGSWVLHMLRSQLGPDLFRTAIKTYLDRHRNTVATTHDLAAVFEEVSGRSWDEFFDQWVFHGGDPQLKVDYAWDESRGQAKLTVRQTQKVGDQVLLFDFPLPVRFIDEDGRRHDFTVRIHETTEDFYFPMTKKAKIVRIDPDLTVLAGIEFTPANPLLHAQLGNPDDTIGRILAAAALGGRKDRDSIDRLGRVLKEDPFYGVRIEAARALTKTQTSEAFDVLAASLGQTDARVRGEVVAGLAKFYSESAFATLRGQVTKEKNPDILADAIAALGKYPHDEVRPLLLASLDRKSFRNRVASSAIQALRLSPDPALAKPLREHLSQNEAGYPAFDYGRALEVLAELAKKTDDPEREETRRFLLATLEHPKEGLRWAAIGALGTLGDPRSIGALRTFVDAGNPGRPETKAAGEAIRKLNGEKPQAAEVGDLRREVLTLQDELKQLRERIDTLGKQTEAASSTPVAPTTPAQVPAAPAQAPAAKP